MNKIHKKTKMIATRNLPNIRKNYKDIQNDEQDETKDQQQDREKDDNLSFYYKMCEYP